MSEFDFKPKIKIKDSSIKSQRQLKVGEELRYLISNVLLKETFYDEYINNNNITITEVNISPDLKNAKIFIMPLGGKNQSEVVDSLNKVSGRIKKLISTSINLRQMPKLNFKIDNSFENAKNESPFLRCVTDTNCPFALTNRMVSASCAIIPPISFPTFALINNIGLFSILHRPIAALLAFPLEFRINTSLPVSNSDRYFVFPSGDNV